MSKKLKQPPLYVNHKHRYITVTMVDGVKFTYCKDCEGNKDE